MLPLSPVGSKLLPVTPVPDQVPPVVPTIKELRLIMPSASQTVLLALESEGSTFCCTFIVIVLDSEHGLVPTV